MAISGLYENSASISTTEYSLPNNSTSLTAKTDVGVFQIVIDLNAMAAGDQYELKIYEKCRSGDTKRLLDVYTFTGAQPKPLVMYPSLILMYGWDVTMKRLAGSDRTIAWSIRQVS